jgi:hypothetical protein
MEVPVKKRECQKCKELREDIRHSAIKPKDWNSRFCSSKCAAEAYDEMMIEISMSLVRSAQTTANREEE